MKGGPRRLAAVIAFLVLALVAAYPPVFLGRETLVPHAPGVLFSGPYGYGEPPPQTVLDPWGTVWEEMPLARVVRDQVRRGLAPLWNPWTACGTPLAAGMHSEAFSPVRWPLIAFPAPRAWDAYFLARLLAAGILAALLAMELGTGAAGAAAAGLGYMLGGYLTLYLNLFHLDVDIFLPGLLLCLNRVLGGGGVWWSVGLALATAQMLLGGNPQAALVDFAFAAAWAAALPRGKSGRSAGPAALAAGTGAALALPLLIPFAEFFRRAFHVHGAQAGAWWGGTVLPWQGWPALVVPLSFGPRLAPVDFHVQGLLPYVGVGALLLSFQGAGWGSPAARRLGWLMAAVCALELAKIFGLPPLGYLGTLPGLNLVVWTKYAAPLFLSAALLAGLGIARVEARAVSRRRAAWSGLVLAAAAVSSIAVTHAPLDWLLGWVFAFLVAAGWWAFGSLPANAAQGKLASLLGVALLAVELAAWVPRPRARPHDPLAPAPYVEFLRGALPGPEAGRVFGLGFNLAPNVNASLGLADPRTLIDPLVFRPYWAFMNAEVAEPRRPAFLGFLKADTLSRRRLEALSFLGVRYLVSTRTADRFVAPGTDWPLRLVHSGDMNVYENPEAWPRAFVLRPAGGEPVPARIVRYSPLAVEIAAPSAAGRLVLTDTAYPGWRAFLDGRRVRITPHAGVFRAVEKGGGTAALLFIYAPLSFPLGLMLAGVLGVGGLLVILLLRRGRGRKTRQS